MRRILGFFSSGRLSSGFNGAIICGFLIVVGFANRGSLPLFQTEQQIAQSKVAANHNKIATAQFKSDKFGVDRTTTGSIAGATRSARRKGYKQPFPGDIGTKNARIKTDPVRSCVTVLPGDTMLSIGLRHGLGMTEIANLNRLKEPYLIRVGQALYISQ